MKRTSSITLDKTVPDIEFDLDAVINFPTFDAAEYLDSGEAIAAYLNEFLDEEDPALLAAALGTAARARGMSNVAESSGISREALYKALRVGSAPRMDTIMRVMKAFGVRLRVEPIESIDESATPSGEVDA